MNALLNETSANVRKYFANGRRKAVAVEAFPGFVLRIIFDNGETRVIDMKDKLSRPAFVPLRNATRFNFVFKVNSL